MSPPRLPKPVLIALDGHVWAVERRSKHWLLRVDGRQAAVFGHRTFSVGDIRSTEHIVAQVRRAIRVGDG